MKNWGSFLKIHILHKYNKEQLIKLEKTPFIGAF